MKQIKEEKITPNILMRKMQDPAFTENVYAGFEAELNFSITEMGITLEGSYDDASLDSEHEVRDYFSDNNTRNAVRNAISDVRSQWRESLSYEASESVDDNALIADHMDDWSIDRGELSELVASKIDNGMDEEDAEEEATEELTDIERERYVDEELDADRSQKFQEYIDEQDFDDYISSTMSSPESWTEYGLDLPTSNDIKDGGFSQTAAEHLKSSLKLEDYVTYVDISDSAGSAIQDEQWVIEPDSSLDPDSGDVAFEIKSPPEPINDVLAYIPKFFAWAKSNGAYCNSKTSFHVGVSIKGGMQDFDYIKCALFLGDEHILQKFGRETNTYTVSVARHLANDPAKEPEWMAKLTKGIDQLKMGAIQDASKTVFAKNRKRYVSINTHVDGANPYVEFRIIGDEYLDQEEEILNTIRKYVYAIRVACDPNAERQLYQKKLTKLLMTHIQNPILSAIANHRIMGTTGPRSKLEYKELLQQLVKSFTGKPVALPDLQFTKKTSPGIFKITFKDGKSTTMNTDSPESVLADLKNQYPDWYLTNVKIEPYTTQDTPKQGKLF